MGEYSMIASIIATGVTRPFAEQKGQEALFYIVALFYIGTIPIFVRFRKTLCVVYFIHRVYEYN